MIGAVVGPVVGPVAPADADGSTTGTAPVTRLPGGDVAPESGPVRSGPDLAGEPAGTPAPAGNDAHVTGGPVSIDHPASGDTAVDAARHAPTAETEAGRHAGGVRHTDDTKHPDDTEDIAGLPSAEGTGSTDPARVGPVEARRPDVQEDTLTAGQIAVAACDSAGAPALAAFLVRAIPMSASLPHPSTAAAPVPSGRTPSEAGATAVVGVTPGSADAGDAGDSTSGTSLPAAGLTVTARGTEPTATAPGSAPATVPPLTAIGQDVHPVAPGRSQPGGDTPDTGATVDATANAAGREGAALGVAAAAPVAASATASSGPGAGVGSPVLDQVLTAVPRLVQRGDGTSKLTLKLHPADLGEVHVTVSVKAGVVDVTLAAGVQAREALGSGSEHLRALLERLGHTSGQVTMRDLATGAVTAGSAPHPGQSWGHGGQPQEQQARQQPGDWVGDPGARPGMEAGGHGGTDTGGHAAAGDGSGRGPGGRPEPGGSQAAGSRARVSASSGSGPSATAGSRAAGLDVTV